MSYNIEKIAVHIVVLMTVSVASAMLNNNINPECQNIRSKIGEAECVAGVSLNTLEPLFASNKVQFVDTRPRLDYESGHIVDAIHFPATALLNESFLKYLPLVNRTKLIVTYCHDSYCNDGRMVADVLRENGLTVQEYPGGWVEWRDLGMPISVGIDSLFEELSDEENKSFF